MLHTKLFSYTAVGLPERCATRYVVGTIHCFTVNNTVLKLIVQCRTKKSRGFFSSKQKGELQSTKNERNVFDYLKGDGFTNNAFDNKYR